MTKLLLIDGNPIAHRAYHAIPVMQNHQGDHTNVVYGFVSILTNLLGTIKPTHLAVVFDEKEITFRRKEYDHYQSKRPKMDEWLSTQIDTVRRWLVEAGVAVYSRGGYEADDIMGTITEKFASNFDEIVIVTGDRDMFQLINDNIRVYVPVKGLKEGKLYGKEEVLNEYDFVPSRIVDYKALVGDSSGNYPGVTGIGPKTARDLIVKYNTIQDIYQNLDKIEGRVKEKLIKGEKDAYFFKKLATIFKEVPIIFDPGKCSEWNLGGVRSVTFLENLGFKTLLKRLPKKENQRELF